jgi:hypothetical protein
VGWGGGWGGEEGGEGKRVGWGRRVGWDWPLPGAGVGGIGCGLGENG